ncbi:MAG: hypothetical protein UZ17_ACD001002565 [Acidobacteria bacterium OLB17]|nr:MAG: hypothetical protein UZ17_ACD001002565 [Acidobacteria bacterium OLB17]
MRPLQHLRVLCVFRLCGFVAVLLASFATASHSLRLRGTSLRLCCRSLSVLCESFAFFAFADSSLRLCGFAGRSFLSRSKTQSSQSTRKERKGKSSSRDCPQRRKDAEEKVFDAYYPTACLLCSLSRADAAASRPCGRFLRDLCDTFAFFAFLGLSSLWALRGISVPAQFLSRNKTQRMKKNVTLTNANGLELLWLRCDFLRNTPQVSW